MPVLGFIHFNKTYTYDGLIGISVSQNNSPAQMYYTQTDHLGSIVQLNDANGNLVYRVNYDPWGREREPITMTYSNATNNKPEWLIRGFTGHEHMPEFKLVNMPALSFVEVNGRLYDPLVGRMLSPDNYVQDATGVHAFNRYSYVYNNPLKYTDPSGEVLLIPLQIVMITFTSLDLLAKGETNVLSKAYHTSNQVLNEFNNAFSISGNISIGDNSSFRIGIDPFALGISAGVNIQNGGLGFSGGIGFGLTSGIYGYGGVNYSKDGTNIGIGVGGGDYGYSIGGSITHNGIGAGYTYNHYNNTKMPEGYFIGSQNSGKVDLYLNDFSISTENDFLVFQGQDRWRSAALTVNYKNYGIGFNVINNDPKNEAITMGIDPNGPDAVNLMGKNLKGKYNNPLSNRGAWRNGFTYSAPLFFESRIGNSYSRVGFSHPRVQDLTQNVIHKHFPPGYQNFYNNYTSSAYNNYYYSGYSLKYSLYGW